METLSTAYWRCARQLRVPDRSRATYGHGPSSRDVRREQGLDRPRNAATPRDDVARPARGATPRLRDDLSYCASYSYGLLCNFRTDSDGDRFENTVAGRELQHPSLHQRHGSIWLGCHQGVHVRVIDAPPSTSEAVPVTKDESSEAR